MFTIETVAVVGASEAGTTCALLASLAGCAVRLHDPIPHALDRAFETVRHRVELALSAGVITRGERQRILDGVLFTPDLEEAVTAADLVVDAGGGADDRFERLAGLLRATAAVAAAGETSPDALAACVPQPGRVLALRLAEVPGPVPRLHVEGTGATAEHVLARAAAFVDRVNRAARTVTRP
jgi:3-hydroxyacyl-CoA dehydrogenase